MEEKRSELQRLRALEAEALEAKLAKLKVLDLGPHRAKEVAALKSLEKNLDLKGEWDPEEFDKQMEAIFDDEYDQQAEVYA